MGLPSNVSGQRHYSIIRRQARIGLSTSPSLLEASAIKKPHSRKIALLNDMLTAV